MALRFLITAVEVLGLFILGLGIVALLARRFARKRESEGAWDDQGPIKPTQPPSNFLHPAWPDSPALDEWLAAVWERRPIRALRRWRRR